jgi:hypothetical protein
MREVDEQQIPKDNAEQIDAIRMIAKGLDALSKVNAEMALHFREAIEALPRPEKLDLSPLQPKEPKAYVFNIKRDSTGKMSKIEAFPK